MRPRCYIEAGQGERVRENVPLRLDDHD